jgi:hypothetical protein
MAGTGRSPNYPVLSLVDAIAKARDLYEQDKKAAVNIESAVKAWGYNSLHGASLRALSALRQYGLLDDTAPKTVKLSGRALTILLEPDGSPERALAISEAANAPTAFADLVAQYPDGLPSDASVISGLVRNGSFNEDAARGLIAALRDTMALVEREGARNTSGVTSGAEPMGDRARSDEPSAQLRKAEPDHGKNGGRMEFTFQLSGGAFATLTVSRGIDDDDVETLADYFATAKKALKKAAAANAARAAEVPPVNAQPA